jgi:hypothetical protein
MRAARVLLFSIIAMVSAPVAAAPKKAAKSDFSDMFAGMDRAPAKSARASKHARTAQSRHAAKVSKVAAKALKPAAKPALVAEAAPRPQPARDQLVLSDFAPDRHALVGP